MYFRHCMYCAAVPSNYVVFLLFPAVLLSALYVCMYVCIYYTHFTNGKPNLGNLSCVLAPPNHCRGKTWCLSVTLSVFVALDLLLRVLEGIDQENGLKWYTFGLPACFHGSVHSCTLGALWGHRIHTSHSPFLQRAYNPAGGLTTSVRRPSVHLCAAGRLCPRRPKQSLPGDGTWAKSGKVRPSRAQRRWGERFRQSSSRSPRFRDRSHCDVWRCWEVRAFWSTSAKPWPDRTRSDCEGLTILAEELKLLELMLSRCLFLLTSLMTCPRHLPLSATRWEIFSRQQSC